MDNHQLKTWLQLHPTTDGSVIANLPFALNSPAEENFSLKDTLRNRPFESTLRHIPGILEPDGLVC